jgi:CHAD domain-containing protein
VLAGPARLIRHPEWIDALWTRIDARSAAAVEATRRAPGVYFPNRAHKARVAIKKLRYSVEVASETGQWHAERLIDDVRRIQGTLGDLHDAQVLLDALDGLLGDQAATPAAATLRALCEDDIGRGHAKYVRRRDRIFAIADACTRAAARGRRGWGSRRTLAAVSLVAAPLLLGVRASRGGES